MTLCPGKRQPHAATGPWDRDLVADMDAVKKFGAAIFITLMEARLLIDLGWEPEAAIADVRTANSYAIETQAQEAHVRAYRRVQA